MSLKTIRTRNHLGLSVWRGEHMVCGVCMLFQVRGPRPGGYPRFHVALDWRGRMWSVFTGGGAAPS